MLKTTIGRLRLVGLIEGSSYLLLLGVAMPLKYAAGMPEAVKYTGQIHGLLFVLYILLVLHAWADKKLNLKWAFLASIAAVLPFGPFLIDGKLKDLKLPAS